MGWSNVLVERFPRMGLIFRVCTHCARLCLYPSQKGGPRYYPDLNCEAAYCSHQHSLLILV